jgi:hypothetical protein
MGAASSIADVESSAREYNPDAVGHTVLRGQQLIDERQKLRDLLESHFSHLHELSEEVTTEEDWNAMLSHLLATAGSEGDERAEKYIESLKAVQVTTDTAKRQPTCPICICKFELQTVNLRLPCGHIFHTGCIKAWLGTNGTCPNCRLDLEQHQLHHPIDPRNQTEHGSSESITARARREGAQMAAALVREPISNSSQVEPVFALSESVTERARREGREMAAAITGLPDSNYSQPLNALLPAV